MYIPPEGYPSWVQVPLVDPATLTATATATPGQEPRKWTSSRNGATVNPGDVIVLPDGEYPTEGLVVDGGTANAPVTIMAQNSRGAVVRPTKGDWKLVGPPDVPEGQDHYVRFVGIVFDASDMSLYIYRPDARHVTFQDCEFRGAVGDNASVLVAEGNDVIFSGCDFHDNYGGLQVGAKDQSYVTNILIENCRSYNNYGSPTDGFVVENKLSPSVLIRDCFSSGHTDAGYDIKPDAEIVRCEGGDNTWDLKLWRGVDARNCVFDTADLAGINPSPRAFTNCTFSQKLRATTNQDPAPLLQFTNCTLPPDDAVSISAKQQENLVIDGTSPTPDPTPDPDPTPTPTDAPTDAEIGRVMRYLHRGE